MNIKAFTKAIRFACVPTLSVLLLLFFGFFSISETIAFISSNNGWAIAIRVILAILEILLIIIMYKHYLAAEIADGTSEDTLKKRKGKKEYWGTRLDSLFPGGTQKDEYYVYKTTDSNIVIVKRTPEILT